MPQSHGEEQHPYDGIPGKNAFRLRAEAVAAPTTPVELELPRISLQGFTTFFGGQVLFQVLPGKAGEKVLSYVAGIGQRNADIEVMAINEKAGTVSFKNHGFVQVLSPMAVAKGTATETTPPNKVQSLPQAPPRFTPGEQAILIEVERERMKKEIDKGSFPPFPPTALTPSPEGDQQ